MMKDPNAVLDFSWDWSGWLTEGETITDAAVTVPDGITKDSESHDDTGVTVWLSGGTPGRHRVVCHVTTSAGRQDDRSLDIDVDDR